VSGLVAIYFLIGWKFDQEEVAILYAAAGIGLVSAVSEIVAILVAKRWMMLGMLMGKVVGTVLLSVVYLLFLTPLARLQSVFSKSEKFRSTAGKEGPKTSWIARQHKFEAKDLEELW